MSVSRALHRSNRSSPCLHKEHNEVLAAARAIMMKIAASWHAASTPLLRCPSLVGSLRMREEGCSEPPLYRRNASRAILLNDNRTYVQCGSYTARGVLAVGGNLMLSYEEKALYNVEIHKRLWALRYIGHDEPIVAHLIAETPNTDTEKSAARTSNWTIILTAAGRLLFVGSQDGRLRAVFRFPNRKYLFRTMDWNRDCCSFAVYGRSRILVQAEGRCACAVAVAMFNIDPIAFAGMFVLSPEVFGELGSVGVVDDVVFTFANNPSAVRSYDLNDFISHCAAARTDAGEGISGEVRLDETPTPIVAPRFCFDFAGNWHSVQFARCCSFYLLSPASQMACAQLHHITDSRVQIRVPQSTKYPVRRLMPADYEPVTFHQDESGRVLRVDGTSLVCSYLYRFGNGHVELRDQWRSTLRVDENRLYRGSRREAMISQYGRRIRAAKDIVLKREFMMIDSVYADVENELIYVLTKCDINSSRLCDEYGSLMAVSSSVLDEDMRYVVFVLDDSTGQIVRLVWMRQQMYQGEDVEFSVSGTVAVFTQASRHGSFMEVQRLQEIGVKKWAANESLTQRATLTGNCQSGETMRWNDKSNASSTAGINAVNVEDIAGSSQLETDYDSSSDPDYVP